MIRAADVLQEKTQAQTVSRFDCLTEFFIPAARPVAAHA
jgi:hypothetical protein